MLGLVLAVFSVWWVVNRSDGNGWRMLKFVRGQGEQQGEGLEAIVLLECVETPFLLNVTGYQSLVMETQPIALSQLLFVFSFFNRS